MSGNDRKKDDLTVIKYIGTDRQQWLRDDLSIRSYQDLSKCSVTEIKDCLKKHGTGVSESIIESWISSAEALARSAREEEQALAVAAAQESAHEREKEASSKKPVGKKAGWVSVGIFVVNIRQRTVKGREEYLTEVSIHENGEQADSAEWPGIEKEEAFAWMLEQAGLEPITIEPQPSATSSEEKRPPGESEGNAEVIINELELFQPPDASKPLARGKTGEPPSQGLRAGEPFLVVVNFSLHGEAAESVVKRRAIYRLRVIANELDTKVGTHLGDSDPAELVAGTLDYTAKSPEAMLAAGDYRLWAMVTIQAANTVPNFLEVPSITVT